MINNHTKMLTPLTDPKILAKEYKSSQQVLTDVIKTIYEETQFNGIVVNGKSYHVIPNQWSHQDRYGDEEKKLECKGYYKHECSLKRRKVVKEDDTYEFIMDYGPFNGKLKKKMFKKNTILYLINNDGFNKDHRGSDHFKYKIPFDTAHRLVNPNFKDFINGLYLLKSHKCDNWYELFSNAKIKHRKYQYNDVCEITLQFDHGS